MHPSRPLGSSLALLVCCASLAAVGACGDAGSADTLTPASAPGGAASPGDGAPGASSGGAADAGDAGAPRGGASSGDASGGAPGDAGGAGGPPAVGTVSPGAGDADEIHWTFTGPTSVTVDWRGSATQIVLGASGTTGTGYTDAFTAGDPSAAPFSSPGPFREAKLTQLRAATTYRYAIGAGAPHTFHTPPAPGASGFTVFVEGDIGDSSSYPAVTDVQSLVAAGAPSFALLVGDLTYGNANGIAAVDQHFDDVMAWSLDAAYMPAWGNHEYDVPSADDFRNYKGRFDFPNPQASPNAPAAGGVGKDWYWFDYGNVRFIAFPEPFDGAWDDWNAKAGPLMDAAQADPNVAFIVTFGHRPAYSTGYHPGDPSLAAIMDALGRAHSKYVLDVCGHSHGYERTTPQAGVVHVVVGTGGADLEQTSGACLWAGGCPAPSSVAFRAMHLGALKLDFTAGGIRGTAECGPPGGGTNDVTCTKGTAMDTFSIGSP